jgi:Lon protease-like protein
MIGKCHRAGAPFGVVTLTQGSEVRSAGAPPEHLAPVGTLAHITALERPQPGLMLMQCRGEQRFRIDRASQLRHGLWVADVTLLPPDRLLDVPDDLQHVARALKQVHAGLRVQSPGAPLPAPGSERYEDCAWVANRWCELLPLPATTKQRLMSLNNPLLRLELVADMLSKTGIEGAQG